MANWYPCCCESGCELCSGSTPAEVDLSITGITSTSRNCSLCESLDGTYTLTQNATNKCLYEFEDTYDVGDTGDPGQCEAVTLTLTAEVIIAGSFALWQVTIVGTDSSDAGNITLRQSPAPTSTTIDCTATISTWSLYTSQQWTSCNLFNVWFSGTVILDPQ